MFKLLLVFLLSVQFTHAHKLPPEVQTIVDEALSLDSSVENGMKLYNSSCVSCHGDRGVPYDRSKSSIPYISKQTPKYLLIHMAMFKTKHRINSSMNLIAKRLSTQDMADLKEFLVSDLVNSSHCNDVEELAIESLESIERGRLLNHKKREFQRADGSTVGISCTMCHGMDGVMDEEVREQTLHPDLAGLGYTYLKKQFLDFKNMNRINAGPMNLMIKDLSRRDIVDLSSYYSSLSRCRN